MKGMGACRCFGLVLAALLVAGCAAQQHRMRSSVVDYLYPDKQREVVEPGVPRLELPVDVGIAFVPADRPSTRGMTVWAGVTAGRDLSETEKLELLDRVADHFRGYDFVGRVEVIPTAYLVPEGGFRNLQQVRTMYGVDVVALVSYDQIQFTDEGMLSLTYWTLIGAYVVSGDKNDTATLMDTAVYDVDSRKLLFRAPGTSRVRGRSTPVNLSEELRTDSVEGFRRATTDMIANLDRELDRFRTRVKEHPEEATIVEGKGYSGGGSAGWLGLLLCAAGCWACRAA